MNRALSVLLLTTLAADSNTDVVVHLGMNLSEARKGSSSIDALPPNFDRGFPGVIENGARFVYSSPSLSFSFSHTYRINLLPEAGAIRYIGVHLAAIHGDVNAARALVRQTIAYISGLEGTCPVRNPNNVLKLSKIDDFGKGPLFYSDLGSAQVSFEKYMADDTVVSIGLLFIPDADRGTTSMGDARIGDTQRATYRIDVDIEKASDLEEALMPPAISATEEIEIEDLLTKLHRQSLWHRKPHARAPFRVQCASGVHGT